MANDPAIPPNFGDTLDEVYNGTVQQLQLATDNQQSLFDSAGQAIRAHVVASDVVADRFISDGLSAVQDQVTAAETEQRIMLDSARRRLQGEYQGALGTARIYGFLPSGTTPEDFVQGAVPQAFSTSPALATGAFPPGAPPAGIAPCQAVPIWPQDALAPLTYLVIAADDSGWLWDGMSDAAVVRTSKYRERFSTWWKAALACWLYTQCHWTIDKVRAKKPIIELAQLTQGSPQPGAQSVAVCQWAGGI